MAETRNVMNTLLQNLAAIENLHAESSNGQLTHEDLIRAARTIGTTNTTTTKERPKMYNYRIKQGDYTIEQFMKDSNLRYTNRDVVTYMYNLPVIYTSEEALADVGDSYGVVYIKFNYNGQEHQYSISVKSLQDASSELREGSVWSNQRHKRLRFDSHYLTEQIRTRYAFFNRPVNGLSNIIIDNFAPKLMYVTNFEQHNLGHVRNLPKTAYAISPWFSQYFGVPQIPTEQLCRYIGYDVKMLKQLITKVKRNDYSITFVGYGGTNVNTIHWLTEIMKFTQMVNLFNFVEVYEPDTIEVSNLLRFPKNPYMENYIPGAGYLPTASKLRLLDPTEMTLLSKNKPNISSNRIDGRRLPYGKAVVYDYSNGRRVPKDRHIYYGAPNIDTRISFGNVGHFISATHNGNTANLWLNPTQDSDLQVESYGLIELTPFFMNQLRLAIGLLETLAGDSLDLREQDRMLLEYSFDGTQVMRTNKTYNFQLEGSTGLVATETQAGAAF